MTDAQRAKMGRFMVSYGAGNDETQVIEGPLWLPAGWIEVTITMPKGTIVQMGIDPDGQGHM